MARGLIAVCKVSPQTDNLKISNVVSLRMLSIHLAIKLFIGLGSVREFAGLEK